MPFPYKDMREFLNDLEADGQLIRIEEPIDVGYKTNELDALEAYMARQEGPCMILSNLVGYNTPDVPLVLNVYGTRKRTAMALGSENERDAKKRVSGILENPESWIDPVIVDRADAPCKEVVIAETDINLKEQIPHVWFGDERQSYPNCSVTVSKDPENCNLNVSVYRYGLLDLDPEGKPYAEDLQKKYMTAYAWWNPPFNDLGVQYAKAVKLGQPLEVAIAFSPDPTLFPIGGGPSILMGTHPWDKYALASAVRGKPVELVACETVDLYVPATAEYVIEGELEFPVREEIDGPHGNFLGYYDPKFILPLIRVKCITRRNSPFWYNTYEMWPPFDHGFIGGAFVAIEILSDLQRKLPQVVDVVMHDGTWTPFAVVQLSVDREDMPFPWFGRHVIHAVWGGAGRFPRMTKFVVVVGPDIDPYNLTDVLIAIVTRTQPKRDFMFNEFGGAQVLDPSAPRGPQGNTLVTEQVGIDATTKTAVETNQDFPEVAKPSKEKVDKIAEKVSHYLSSLRR